MEEEIKWQFAPEFYKYVVSLMDKASSHKQVEDYDNAFTCYIDIYSSLHPIIEKMALKLADELKIQKAKCEESQDDIYFWTLKPDQPNKHINIGKNMRLFKRNIEYFHEMLMKGAYISGILVPINKSIEKGKEALQVRY